MPNHADAELTSLDKEALERVKLRDEIFALRHPFRQNPALWLSVLTALAAAVAVFLQYRLSQAEFILGQARAVEAKNAVTEAEWRLAEVQKELQIVRTELERADSDLDTAAALVEKLKVTPATMLQSEIRGFEAVRRANLEARKLRVIDHR
jgi:hypothetical protein